MGKSISNYREVKAADNQQMFVILRALLEYIPLTTDTKIINPIISYSQSVTVQTCDITASQHQLSETVTQLKALSMSDPQVNKYQHYLLMYIRLL